MDCLTISDNFWVFGFFLWIFWIFWIFVGFVWDFLDFLGFLDVLNYFFLFVCFFRIPFKVTKVTTKSYHGYYWTPKNDQNGPNSILSPFFYPKGKKKPRPKAKDLCRS